MSDAGDRFAEKAPGVVRAASGREGEYIHEYRGSIESVEESVRLLTLAPQISDEAVHDAFARVAGQWHNPSTHPNVVTVHDRGTTPRPWLAVADPDGQPLDTLQSHLSVPEVRSIITDVAEALRNANLYNSTHLALTPADIWVLNTDDGRQALVDGWGLERACRVAAGETPLTPFTAPELVDDPDSGTEETDVYGLGALAYFALTGQPPVAGGDLEAAITEGEVVPPSERSSFLPAAVDDVLATALARRPDDRYDSAYAFQTAVTQVLPKEPLRDTDSQQATEADTDTDAETETDAGEVRHVDDIEADATTGDERGLTDIRVVDEATAATLRESGFSTVEHLRGANEAQLAEVEGISASFAARIKFGAGQLQLPTDDNGGDTQHSQSQDTSAGISRRTLLGGLGAGAVGLGAIALTNTGNDNDGPSSVEDRSTDTGSGGSVDSDTDGGGSGTTEQQDEKPNFPSLGNYPIEGDEVTFGFNVPQSGPYSNEGADELRAYNLAADHLNNGGGWVDMWSDLSGDGVLGKTVTSVEGDTATDPDTARQALSRMIIRDDVIMASGGSSSAVAIAQQRLAQEEKVMFMCCLTHSNDTTGPSCVRYGFREMYNAFMTGQALAPVVADEYGEDLNFYQLYADYSWGQNLQDSMAQSLQSEANWNEIDSVATRLGTTDYSSFLADVPDEAQVLVLNHYGLDAAASLSQAIDAGMDEDMEIIVPLYTREMAKAAADSIGGIIGTADWSWQLEDDSSRMFTQSFRDEFQKVPSYAARLAYTQTMQYAAACERAGTFYPPEVIRELEDHEFEQAGLGPEMMRGCDHQAQRDIIVVRGLPEFAQTEDRLLEIVDRTSREQLGYACDEGLAAECELGQYGDE